MNKYNKWIKLKSPFNRIMIKYKDGELDYIDIPLFPYSKSLEEDKKQIISEHKKFCNDKTGKFAKCYIIEEKNLRGLAIIHCKDRVLFHSKNINNILKYIKS